MPHASHESLTMLLVCFGNACTISITRFKGILAVLINVIRTFDGSA